jgi:nucleoside-diphosphate-sugar epimerase
LADDIADHFPDLEIHNTPIQFEDHRNYRVLSAKARLELGFDPVTPLSDGIREIKSLLDEGRILNPFSPRYRNHEHLALAKEAVR